jgi:hypothetical protein
MISLKNNIRSYLFTHGRKLEQTLFLYHFESGSIDDVIAALKAYQNPDGGFGHGIEPDFHTPESSPIGTWTAINILRTLPIQNHPIIDEILNYLAHCHDQKNGLFHFSIPSINDHPHAPWWHFDAKKNIPNYNPTASLLGFMIKHLPKDHSTYQDVLKRLNKAVSHFIENDISEMHELRCFVELYHDLPSDLMNDHFKNKLKSRILETVDAHKENWFVSYTVLPSTLILSTKTPGYDQLKKLVADEHNMLIEKRNAHGVWSITWDWSDQDPLAFEKARKAWEGIIAFNVLLRLKSFDFKEVA